MHPRKFGDAWEVLAPAKLNLYLDILGRRPDGFHELETLMAPIGLYDHLSWRPAEGLSVEYDPSTPAAYQKAAPPDADNLVYRAAVQLANLAGVEPHGQITLTKRIPLQAGLGGGSSDAAATLQLLNAAWRLRLAPRQLGEIAAGLGSDVPFFLAGGPAICRGRGESVEPVELPRLRVVVATPPVGISTAQAFARLNAVEFNADAPPKSDGALARLLHHLSRCDLAMAGCEMKNALQGAARSLTPWIDRLGIAFASMSCSAHQLTGSGSAYFGVMRSDRHARRTARALSSIGLGRVFAAATCRQVSHQQGV